MNAKIQRAPSGPYVTLTISKIDANGHFFVKDENGTDDDPHNTKDEAMQTIAQVLDELEQA